MITYNPPTPPKRHAKNLAAVHGQAKALEMAQQKLSDSFFLVNGDPDFWRKVVAYLLPSA